jgi:hypothetical protein
MCWSCLERGARALLLLAALAGGAAWAGCGDGLKQARLVEGQHHQIAWSASPAVAVGKHFALDVVACPRAGGTGPDALTVDARMPEHGHGMGYQPQARRTARGRWRVEGLMLHMRGRWELSFALGAGPQAERITDVLQLK